MGPCGDRLRAAVGAAGIRRHRVCRAGRPVPARVAVSRRLSDRLRSPKRGGTALALERLPAACRSLCRHSGLSGLQRHRVRRRGAGERGCQGILVATLVGSGGRLRSCRERAGVSPERALRLRTLDCAGSRLLRGPRRALRAHPRRPPAVGVPDGRARGGVRSCSEVRAERPRRASQGGSLRVVFRSRVSGGGAHRSGQMLRRRLLRASLRPAAPRGGTEVGRRRGDLRCAVCEDGFPRAVPGNRRKAHGGGFSRIRVEQLHGRDADGSAAAEEQRRRIVEFWRGGLFFASAGGQFGRSGRPLGASAFAPAKELGRVRRRAGHHPLCGHQGRRRRCGIRGALALRRGHQPTIHDLDQRASARSRTRWGSVRLVLGAHAAPSRNPSRWKRAAGGRPPRAGVPPRLRIGRHGGMDLGGRRKGGGALDADLGRLLRQRRHPAARRAFPGASFNEEEDIPRGGEAAATPSAERIAGNGACRNRRRFGKARRRGGARGVFRARARSSPWSALRWRPRRTAAPFGPSRLATI